VGLVPGALPKYEPAGAKKLRVLSAQQGFTVGAIVVSAVRKETPREADIKELEKLRFGARRTAARPDGLHPARVLAGIEGSTVEDLTKSAAFSGKPSGSSLREIFEAPVNFGDKFGARMRGYVPSAAQRRLHVLDRQRRRLRAVAQQRRHAGEAAARRQLRWAAGPRDWTRAPTCEVRPDPARRGKALLHRSAPQGRRRRRSPGRRLDIAGQHDERPIPGSRLSALGVPPPPSGPPGTVFYRGYNIGGPPTVIDGRKWEGKARPTSPPPGEGLGLPECPAHFRRRTTRARR
jgi:hypothetical protein